MVEVVNGSKAQKDIIKAVNLVGDSVGSTMGAKGRFVLVNKKNVATHATKDGVTVAVAIDQEEGTVGAVVKAIQEAAIRTVNDSGDGTTATVVLSQHITKEGIKNVVAGSNPIDIKRGIELGTKEVTDKIKKLTKAVVSDEDIRNVAIVSANNDVDTGSLVASAKIRVGKDGLVEIEPSKTPETTVEYKDGYIFENGYMNPQLINSNGKSELHRPAILLTNHNINTFSDLEPTIKIMMTNEKGEPYGRTKDGKPIMNPLVIIAKDVTSDAYATILTNVRELGLPINLVKAYGQGRLMEDFLADLAYVTGAKVISNNLGESLLDIKPEHFGLAEKVVSTFNETRIISGNGDKERLKKRIEMVKVQIEEGGSTEYENKERLAKLTGGVAVIKVGAPTPTERKEKADRVDDALRAVEAAIEEGIVSGGGSTLLHIQKSMKSKFDNEDIQKGYNVLKSALSIPMYRILSNAGKNADLLVGLASMSKKPMGYNLEDDGDDSLVDLMKEGIIDPSKVIRISLESAASLSSVLLTVSVVINYDE